MLLYFNRYEKISEFIFSVQDNLIHMNIKCLHNEVLNKVIKKVYANVSEKNLLDLEI